MYEHDGHARPVYDEHGWLIERENLLIDCLNTDLYTYAFDCAMTSRKYGKIYIAFGINVAGYPLSSFSSQYREVVRYVRSLQPDAVIILQAILPVTERYAGGPTYFAPANLDKMNQVIAGCANGTDTFYVDPNPWFANQNGYLYSDLTGDGCHLTTSHYTTWKNWISYIIGKNNIG